MPTHKMVVPFIRQEVNGVSTIAILEVVTTKKMSQINLMLALTKIITHWVKNTDEGIAALADCNGDFNIGDYALYESRIHDQTPHSIYTKNGIQDIKILFNGEVDGAELYDRKLVE